ncbi:DUF4224 domain-containing protein [Arsenophonus nasoniae]|uniref:DUF4224 domain-containing protein n=1 Tax=Arsenophonus nasoniae TaxID=638 RepID=A0AA95K825_9GAMM|nr:DUF4224 domain-containing protein [Arsenophonus nasoniae]WGL95958.1 DUF4224 domain-containing protein [Arsenophonus nasoniae]
MQSIYLSDDELARMTGYKQKRAQIKWLEKNQLPHLVNKLGKPVVFRDLLFNKQKIIDKNEVKPDFGALTNGKET